MSSAGTDGGAAATPGELPWRRLAPALAVGVSGVMTAAVFRHELRSDDFVHCFESVHFPFWKFLWTPYGGHILPVYRLVYALLRPIFGLSPFPYFLLAFVTHLASVYLFYEVLLRLTHRERWAAFWAGLWGTALASVGTLVLFATYGQAEAGFLALLVLCDLVGFAERKVVPGTLRLALWSLALLLGTLAFGIGTSIAFGMFVCAALLLRGPGARRAAAWVGASAFGIFFFYRWFQEEAGDVTALDPGLLGYYAKSFVLFSARGVADLFLPALFTLTTGEEAVGPLRRASDEWVLFATLVVGVGLSAVLLRAARSLGGERRRAWVAVTVVALGNYALISLARSATARALGATLPVFIQSIRYHYVNLAFVTASFAIGLSEWEPLARWLREPSRRQAIAGWAGAVFVTSAVSAQEIYRPDSAEARAARLGLARKVRAAVRAAPPGSTVLLPNDPYPPTRFLFAVGVPASRFPHSAAAWLCNRGGEVVEGRQIRFVERDRALLEELRREPGSPAGRLIIAPQESGKTSPPRLTLGEPGARSRVLGGIYDEDQKGYAWTAQKFGVVLGVTRELADRGGTLHMTVYVPDQVIQALHRVVLSGRIASTELPPHTFDQPGIVEVEFPVAPNAFAPGDVEIQLALDRKFSAPEDDRELGILVHQFELVPR